MFKYLTLDEVLEMAYPFAEHEQNEIIIQSTIADEVNRYFPAQLMFAFSDITTYPHYEHCLIKLVTERLDFEISYSTREKKYSIFCRSLHRDFDYVSSYEKTQAQQKLNTPQKIGVLNTKKIQDWINFNTDLYDLLTEVNIKHLREESEFIAEIDNLNLDTEWSKDRTRGSIEKNGILFYFHLEKTHIHTSLDLSRDIEADLQTFLQLSNNKLKKSRAAL